MRYSGESKKPDFDGGRATTRAKSVLIGALTAAGIGASCSAVAGIVILSATAGIHGGDSALNGIHGGDNTLNGIHGGDSTLNGIHGGDSALNGIHGGDNTLNGIHGGDSALNGIHGGDSALNGIHGGDNTLNGIHGGDSALNGIHGGDHQIFESIAIGPVDELLRGSAGAELSILGQRFRTDARLADIANGDYVIAAGSAEQLMVLLPISTPYIAGASPITVRGQIAAVDQSVAALTVGRLSLDYSPMLSVDASFSPQAGQTIQFTGVQPNPGGLAILTLSRNLDGIHGGDSALNGIHGGDRALNGIHGGDRALNGIHGGDSALNGIHGGDRALNGIHGGDNALNGIHGGDSALNGIHGGDRALNGIHGSDLQ